MKLLALTNNLLELSGWGRYAASVAREYLVQCPDFEVLTEQGHGPINVKLHERAVLRPLRSRLDFLRNCWVTRKVGWSSDVVHAFDGWPYSVYGYIATFATKKKLFITGVGTYSVAPFENWLQRWFMAKAYKKAQNIFCVSRYTQQRILEKISLSNTSIVPWAPKPLPELTSQQIQEYKRRFQIGSEHPVILTIGQIKQRKGQFDTLRAVAQLRKKYPEILYLLVGSSSDADYLQKIMDFIERNDMDAHVKIFSDITTDEELAFFYAGCDVFAMNSNNDGGHFEGFGLVFLEAMQFGKPVVGSQGCGIEDAVFDGVNGYLAKQGDSTDITRALDQVLSGKGVDLGRGSSEVYKKFSWQKTVREYVKNYSLPV